MFKSEKCHVKKVRLPKNVHLKKNNVKCEEKTKFAKNSDVIIPISLQFNVVDRWIKYSKFKISKTQFLYLFINTF